VARVLASCAASDLGGARAGQLRQHIGRQTGQGRFEQHLAQVLRRRVFFGRVGSLLGGRRLVVGRRRLIFGWRLVVGRFSGGLWWLLGGSLLLGRCRHLGSPRRQAQAGSTAQINIFHRRAFAQRRQHAGQAHTGQGTTQTGNAHGLGHLGNSLNLLIIQAQCAQTFKHCLALGIGGFIWAGQHTQEAQNLIAGRFLPTQVAQIQPNAQTLLQALAHAGFIFQCLVQSDQA